MEDYSKYVPTLDSLYYLSCDINYGIAVILGPYNFTDYPDKTGENLLITGLTNSVVIAFRANQNQIAIYNCKKNECNINNVTKKTDYTFENELILSLNPSLK